MLVQYLTAKAGLVTGRSLPELCRDRFGPRVNMLLWLQAEAVAISTDMAEIVGAAVGLNLVFGVPLLMGGAVTVVAAFGILALEQRGYRRYELAVIALLALVGVGFCYLFFAVGGQSYGSLARGLVPHLGSSQGPSLAVAIIGATVMPHAVYLHSALHQGRVRAVGASASQRRLLLLSNKWDCVLGLGIAGLVNLAMLCVAAVLFRQGASFHAGFPGGAQQGGLAGQGDFWVISHRLAVLVGGGAALAFGVALMASGLSASTVGTHAGQVVMAGFTHWHVRLGWRRALTAVPSLIILALPVATGQVLIYSQIVLSFGIPFALVPLLLVTRDRQVMGELANRRLTSLAALAATVAITGMNVLLIASALLPAAIWATSRGHGETATIWRRHVRAATTWRRP